MEATSFRRHRPKARGKDGGHSGSDGLTVASDGGLTVRAFKANVKGL